MDKGRTLHSIPEKELLCAIRLCEEGVQGVLTLFCSGAAQVCHDDRVVELKETGRGGRGRREQTGGKGRSRKGEARRHG